MTAPDPGAVRVLDLALSRPPTLGLARLICIDGPAGAGKTTLAARVKALTPCTVVHMDDLYDGWSGLPRIDAQLATLLPPLAQARAGSYRRYDWTADAFAETVTVGPEPLLVLEGVGSGAMAYAALCTVLVYVEAPHDLRMARGVAREGEALASRWEQWARDEADLLARERTRERADLVLATG